MNPPDDNARGLLRLIPQVNELAASAEQAAACDGVPRQVITRVAREVTESLRTEILSGHPVAEEDLSMEKLELEVCAAAARLMRPSLVKVINATGVVLHTNLGRSPLSIDALDAVKEASGGYCNLEYDVGSGERGSRQQHVEELLRSLTGASAAYAVNNNAAAVLLVLTALARGREVIVSRGELVEIGDSFRLPDIMHQSGARLVEVGTTNRTRPSDYLNAIGPDTALIMKIHPSNFRIVGYSEDVSLAELVAIAGPQFIPVVEDMGSGSLVDLAPAGLPGEHTAAQSIEAGADLVTFSGDKLLGGPQAGIIVGSSDYVESVRRHPLARALRIDKMSVAALEATLRAYLDPEKAFRDVPALRMLSEPADAVRARARRLKRMLGAAGELTCEIVSEESRAGGGSLPLTGIPTWCLRLTHSSRPAESLERELRAGEPPVLGRVKDDALLLDLRTVADADLPLLAGAIHDLD
ncbi:MAG TPA: L-seryl-tRNA(Sec) selenium transferase [Candidatus Anoxymicrobiaceae bacterium]|jgi:L-seryl-tRNA(Ser) seleniumtransferase